MSDFGDFDEDDALDHEPADPEQVARKLHTYLLENGIELQSWDDLTPEQKALRVFILTRLLAWMRRQGAFA